MQSILSIALLTWRAAFRFRLFLVVAALLVMAVVALPILVKDDGTAQGFTQILLTYTLTVITTLLGLSTLWLACGTLARDIEECQMQVVLVKPVARWQVWLGKWMGILSLNAMLLALSGACVFLLLQWRAARLPAEQQQVLRNEVLVSRGSAKPVDPMDDIRAEADRILQERLQTADVAGVNVAEVRRQIIEELKATLQLVPPGYPRGWVIDLGQAAASVADRPLQLRFKFNTAVRAGEATFDGIWQAGDPESQRVWQSDPMSLAPDAFHEIEIPPGYLTPDGELIVVFMNPNDMTLLFPLEDGVEVLYREGSFLMNYARALMIIFCWMALLASIGLSASSFLSFPVASLLSVSLLILALSSGTMALVVDEGTVMGLDESTQVMGSSVVDALAVPVFKGLLSVITLAKDYSPIDALSTGRSIPWTTVVEAFLKVVGIVGGCFAVAGIYLFSRRELATAQGNQ